MDASAPLWTAIGSLASSGAFLVALLLYLHEKKVRRRDEEALRREQARAVSAWIQAIEPLDDGRACLPVVIANLSSNPVSKVTLQIVESDGRVWLEWKMPVVQPQGWHTHHFEIDDPSVQVATDQLHFGFTDGQGRRWRRTEHGIDEVR